MRKYILYNGVLVDRYDRCVSISIVNNELQNNNHSDPSADDALWTQFPVQL